MEELFEASYESYFYFPELIFKGMIFQLWNLQFHSLRIER